jgi:hypothetical protein
MNSQPTKPTNIVENEMASLKRTYQAPILQCYGLVAELTNSTAGSCNNDGNADCKVGTSSMVMA